MFKFSRLTFRIKLTQVIFQQVRYTMLCGINFAVTYLDDILLKSKNPEEYKKNVFEIFSRILDWIQAKRQKMRIFYE